MPIGCRILALFLFFLLNCYGFETLRAQENCEEGEQGTFYVAIEYLGLSFHPGGGSTPEIYPLKLDEQGYWVVEVGGVLSIDYYFHKRFFVRGSIAHYLDCANVPAGYFHIGFRGVIFQSGKHTIVGGMGPTLLYREDWHQFPEYKGDPFYGDRVYGKWQYRFIFYGGEFTYLYDLTDRAQLQCSIVPGIPIVLVLKVGLRIEL